mmetsp:Transcript_11491/g.36664  ORF Transcript_11491/g.36664 Transcript_11491/m.36664 type:complete len:2044 (-) Transcript_11491:356-6487(-)
MLKQGPTWPAMAVLKIHRSLLALGLFAGTSSNLGLAQDAPYVVPECPTGAVCGRADYETKSYPCDATTTPLERGQADIVEFRCLDGGCIYVEGFKNGFSNCDDGSDESAPVVQTQPPAAPTTTPEPTTTPAPSTTTLPPTTLTTTEPTTTLPPTTQPPTAEPTTTQAPTTEPPTTEPTTTQPPTTTTVPPPPPTSTVATTTSTMPSTTTVAPVPPVISTTTAPLLPPTTTTQLPTTTSRIIGPAIKTVNMDVPGSGEVLYVGPLDEQGRAHGTGKFQYSDGNLFFGLMSHGEMQAGVLYSRAGVQGRTPKMTMKAGQWTAPGDSTGNLPVDPWIVNAFPMPQVFSGPLTVTIVSGSSLPNSDWLDASDSFVEGQFFGFLSTQFQTPVVQNNLNPTWNYAVNLPQVESGDTMTLKVRDRDSWESDDHLGHAILTFDKVPVTQKLPLVGKDAQLTVTVVASSDSEVEAVVGGHCKQYLVGDSSTAKISGEALLTSGIQYTLSKNFNDLDQAAASFAPWGSVVNALDAGSGWLQICKPPSLETATQWFLPKADPNGQVVMLPFSAEVSAPPIQQSADESDDPQTIHSPPAPSMEQTTLEPTTTPAATTSAAVMQTTTALGKATTLTLLADAWGDDEAWNDWSASTSVKATTTPRTTTTVAPPPPVPSTTPMVTPTAAPLPKKPAPAVAPAASEQDLPATKAEMADDGVKPAAGIPVNRSIGDTMQDPTYSAAKEQEMIEAAEASIEVDHSVGPLHKGDDVFVIASFTGKRSCKSPPSKQDAYVSEAAAATGVGSLCDSSGVTVWPGTDGTVLELGPEGSAIVRFRANIPPQLVLVEQFEAFAIDHKDSCSQSAVTVSTGFQTKAGTELWSGETGTMSHLTPDMMNISFPTVAEPQIIGASYFSKLGCNDAGRTCLGSAVQVLQDFVLDSGHEVAAGQWGTLQSLTKTGDALVQFDSSDDADPQTVKKKYIKRLGCLAEQPEQKKAQVDLFAAFYEPPAWLSKFLAGTGEQKPATAKDEQRRLEAQTTQTNTTTTTASPMENVFKAVATPADPSWLTPAAAPAADPAMQAGATPIDMCDPPELASASDSSIEVLFSVAVLHLSFDPTKKMSDMQAVVGDALRNITGPAKVSVEIRLGAPTILLGKLSLRDGGTDPREACSELRAQASMALQKALVKATSGNQTKSSSSTSSSSSGSSSSGSTGSNSTAAGGMVLKVMGGQYSVQSSEPQRHPDPQATQVTYAFEVVLTGFETDRVTGNAKLQSLVQQKVLDGIQLAVGSTAGNAAQGRFLLSEADVTLKATFNADDIVLSAVVQTASVKDAMQVSANLGAGGQAYLQAEVRPVIGTSALARVKVGAVTYPQTLPNTASFASNTLSAESWKFLELSGMRKLSVVPSFDIAAYAVTTVLTTTTNIPVHMVRDNCLLAPYPVMAPPVLPSVPRVPELDSSEAVPMPPLPPLPPWPLVLRDEEDWPLARLVQEQEQNNNDWQRQPINIFNLSETLACSCTDVTYEPLDMPGQGSTKEITIAACQSRCAQTRGCATWAYWLEGGMCHLQNAFAYRTTSRFGFISGPAGCNTNQESLLLLEIELKKQVCFEIDTSYVRLDMAGTTPSRVNFVLDCQQRCRDHCGCVHFTFNSLSGTCHLADASSNAVPNMEYYVAGPPVCNQPIEFSFTIMNLAYDCVADHNTMMYKLELLIRSAVAAQTGFKICIRNIAVVLRPYRATWISAFGNPSKHMFVQVLVWPPNDMTVPQLNATLNKTASLTRKLETAIRMQTCLLVCRRGFCIQVVDVTTPQSIEDITLTGRHKKLGPGPAANPGEDVAQEARAEQARAARADQAQKDLEQVRQDEVKVGDFFRRSAIPYGSAFFLFSLVACTSAGFVGVSGGIAYARSMGVRSRQRRLQEAGLAGPMMGYLGSMDQEEEETSLFSSMGSPAEEDWEPRHSHALATPRPARAASDPPPLDMELAEAESARLLPHAASAPRRLGVSAMNPVLRPGFGTLGALAACGADNRDEGEAREVLVGVRMNSLFLNLGDADADGGDLDPPSD